MVHRGFHRTIEVVEIVGMRLDEASEYDKRRAGGTLEPDGEAIHVRQHSEFAIATVIAGEFAVNTG
jgi:hypothetical protein